MWEGIGQVVGWVLSALFWGVVLLIAIPVVVGIVLSIIRLVEYLDQQDQQNAPARQADAELRRRQAAAKMQADLLKARRQDEIRAMNDLQKSGQPIRIINKGD